MFLVRPQSDDDTAPAIPVAPGVDRDTTGDERIDVLVVGVAQVLLARGVKGKRGSQRLGLLDCPLHTEHAGGLMWDARHRVGAWNIAVVVEHVGLRASGYLVHLGLA
jgi:hypothetical protein